MSDELLTAARVEPGLDEPTEATESFEAAYKEFERTHQRRDAEDGRQIRAMVVSVTAEAV